MDFQIGLVIAGLTVGFIVGLTGVGGGSLMTPILLWFGIPPTTAVLISTLNGRYLCASKKKNINWTITITRQRSCCITYFVDFTYYKNRHHSFERHN
jgi:uncharacterized membrane protein YfcA